MRLMKYYVLLVTIACLSCIQFHTISSAEFSFTEKVDSLVDEENAERSGEKEITTAVGNDNDADSFRFKSSVSKTLMEASDSMATRKKGGAKKSKGSKKASSKKSKASKKASKKRDKASKKCSKKGGKGCDTKSKITSPSKPSIVPAIKVPAPVSTPSNFFSSAEEPCIMCEYMIEMAQRMMKAQPRMMAGNGFTPGVVDFGSGSLGSFMETKEGGGSRKKLVSNNNNNNNRHTNSRKLSLAKPAWYGRSRRTDSKANLPSSKFKFKPAFIETQFKSSSRKGGKGGQDKNKEKSGLGKLIDNGIKAAKDAVKRGISKLKCSAAKKLPKGIGASLVKKHCPKPNSKPPTPKTPTKPKPPTKKSPAPKTPAPQPNTQHFVDRFRGRWGPRDVNKINEMMEKDKEFEDTYKLVMDSFDDTCYHDFPKEYQIICKNMYHYGGEIVEMLLHNFQDWEICEKFMCPAGFFSN